MTTTDKSRADALTTTKLPDGSGFAVASLPLPQDHWLYASRCAEWDSERDTSADTPHPILTHAQRDAVVAAVRYAIRSATMCGQDMDFDPDALVLNAVYALCGPFSSLLEDNAACPVEQPAAAPIDTPTDREFALSAAICVHPKGVYGDEGGSMCCPITHTRDASFAPSPAAERAAFEAWRDKRAFNMPSYGGLAEAYAWDAWQARAASANETGAEGAEPMAIPAGWKLVPVAPTFEMCRAMEEAIDAGWKDSIVWARGIAAAPQPAQADAREGLTDEQREAIEYAITRMDLNVSNRDAYTAAKELRALLNGADHAE